MKCLIQKLISFSLIVITGISPSLAQNAAEDRDSIVIQVVLTNLLTQPEFSFSRRSSPDVKPRIVFVSIATNSFRIRQEQIQNEVDKPLPTEEFKSLQSRNDPDEMARSNFPKNISFRDNRIIVAPISPDELEAGTFEKRFPEARGWLQIAAPGFSRDGTSAIVRGRIGPFPHSAFVTAVLNKSDTGWKIIWIKLAFYN